MRKLFLRLIFTLFPFYTFAQVNMELQSVVTYEERLSDIWGYTDSLGGEYALVGLLNGVAIENITNPRQPWRVGIYGGPRSIWRDVKTFGQHAYIINETSGGLQVIDLKNLPEAPDSTDSYFWNPTIPNLGSLEECHNLYIDTETGYGFLAGCNLNNGGVIIIDLFTDAGHPIYVAAAAPVYAHDVYTRGNFIYSSDINDGTFAIQDMTDKNNIFTVATQRTPFAFTHNAWLSDDSKVIFTTDERGNASVGAYDISDMNNIEYLDEFRPLGSLNEGLIPHNVHVIDNYLVTSFYTEGVIITDAKRPNNLIEVGNYDTFGGPNGGFNGTWGAFPFFDSGIVLATDIRSGLFVLQPTYTRACYLEGITTDSITGLPLEGVTVRIVSDDPNLDISRASGEYRTGQVTPGTFEVVFSRPNYTSKTISVNLSNGELTALNVSLAPEQDLVSSIPLLNEVIEFNVFPNPFVQQTNVQLAFSDLPNAAELVVTDFLGRIVERQPITQKRNNFIIGQNWESGIYTLQIIAKNRASLPLKIIKN